MSFFSFLKAPDITQGVKQYKITPGAVLLDVRTPAEYAEGHIPESKNLPLHQLDDAAASIPEKSTPLFVYCQSGARSRQATAELVAMGYQSVNNIGGIMNYDGPLA